MDQLDATNVLFSKIKNLDPDNASKVMGYILIQDLHERDLLRLALAPDALLQSLVLTAKLNLGLSSNTFSAPSTPSSPSSLNPISRPVGNPVQNLFSQSPRVSGNGFLSSSPKSSPLLSYENIRSGALLVSTFSNLKHANGLADGDLFHQQQTGEHFSFLNDPSPKTEEFVDSRAEFGYSVGNGDAHLHRRSFSESDACFWSEDRPCLYFARGFCKNGENCKFSHGDLADGMDGNAVIVGSPSQRDILYHQQEELMRMRAAHQQRLAAAQFMAGHSSLSLDKSMNLILQNDPQRAAALMLGEEICKYGRGRPEGNDFLAMGFAEKGNSAARQIYLTFPADSTFKDEDVSNYFSMFGPVQDVRIPHQQKRMFGFVTFVHPETVKLILARGNPHFICDSRVLVKPYKEKGKLPERRQHLQQQLERGNFSPCSSPSGLDSRDSYDLHLGAKMFYNAQEMILRRKLAEQADLQHAIEVQRSRFINLQLPDFKNDSVHHHQHGLSVGACINLPSYAHMDQNTILPSHSIDQGVTDADTASVEVLQSKGSSTCTQACGDGSSKECLNIERCCESGIEHSLPDSLFASPKKSAEVNHSEFSAPGEVDESATTSSSVSAPVSSSTTSGGETESI